MPRQRDIVQPAAMTITNGLQLLRRKLQIRSQFWLYKKNIKCAGLINSVFDDYWHEVSTYNVYTIVYR